MEEPWFKAKRYGWGWVPSTWQGWLILLIYGAIVILAIGLITPNYSPTGIIAYISIVVMASVALFIVCAKTGEPPRWRWGNDK